MVGDSYSLTKEFESPADFFCARRGILVHMKSFVSDGDIFKLVVWFLVALTTSLCVSLYFSAFVVFLVACVLSMLGLFVMRPAWGLYTLAFFAPLSGLVIDFSRDQSLSRVPYIGSVNAPVVDFFALILLVVCGVLVVLRPHALHWRAARSYAWVFAVWFVAVLLSVYFGDALYFGTAVKAFARPYVFTFVAFALPVMLLARGRGELYKSLCAYELACVGGAVMGAASIFLLPAIGFFRAEPFEIFGFAPFGLNHNVLAEALTAIIPFAWYAALCAARGSARRMVMLCAAALISAVSLATFSRAAWLVVAAQLACWFVYRQKHRGHQRITWLIVAVALIGTFFLWIGNTSVAEGSDATRGDLLGIAYTYFLRAPLFGVGPGTFVSLVGETKIFTMQYGDPLDAHGVLEKLLPETGIVGTGAFILMLAVVGGALWHRRRDAFQYMLFVTFVSVWTYQLFNTGYFAGKVWVLVGICIASLSL